MKTKLKSSKSLNLHVLQKHSYLSNCHTKHEVMTINCLSEIHSNARRSVTTRLETVNKPGIYDINNIGHF